jgi:hypothetical protein
MLMMRSKMRLGLGAFTFVVLMIIYLSGSLPEKTTIPINGIGEAHGHSTAKPKPKTDRQGGGDPKAGGPTPPKSAPRDTHPMWQLITQGEKDLAEMKKRQSKTLEDAVKEYKKRYHISPPPNFDKWFEFAKKRDTQLPDEFDSIMEMITPFWGLSPATTRARAAEVLGGDNAMMGISIRKGKITHIKGADEWQRDATQGMLEPFVEYLPDMDLAFNLHDEPRVIVPHEDMVKLVDHAQKVTMPKAEKQEAPRNKFTKKVEGLSDGTGFREVKTTRFNTFAHQPTWTHSRMSCPPESPARALEEDMRRDDMAKYAMTELGFIYNLTASMDICLSPTLEQTYGFFDRPNAFNIVHDLFPVFSQSKVSSFADIIYPSPWYWAHKVQYNESRDMDWNDKQDLFYWRGSTTGGFSREGGWRRQHRQRFVEKLNKNEKAKILDNMGDDDHQKWFPKEVQRRKYKDLMDVHFSHVGQCDEGDCVAQKEFFEIAPGADQQDAWAYKYLLDMDGNAFSGRFYAFLQSKSLIFKFALFREWHAEWIKPWVHYIPLSLQGDEWLEAVRFFDDETLGKKDGERLAMQSREWANQAVRNEDMEVWFFRLLLEYGRVVDDEREFIGFSL